MVTHTTVAWAFCTLVVVGLLATYWTTYDAPCLVDVAVAPGPSAAPSAPTARPLVHSALTP